MAGILGLANPSSSPHLTGRNRQRGGAADLGSIRVGLGMTLQGGEAYLPSNPTSKPTAISATRARGNFCEGF